MSVQAQTVYYDASSLEECPQMYVCWLDLMGARSAMRRSLQTAANFIMKIHVACQEEIKSSTGITLIPMIDGLYILSSQRSQLEVFLKAVMGKLAATFMQEETPLFRFLIRGGIAFGPVATGDRLAGGAKALSKCKAYTDNIAIGVPLSEAFEAEHIAPPFGFSIAQSARTFAPKGEKTYPAVFWRWCSGTGLGKDLLQKVEDYYAWAECHSLSLEYALDRMKVHRPRSTSASEQLTVPRAGPDVPEITEEHRESRKLLPVVRG
jgi:hypothetical protein